METGRRAWQMRAVEHRHGAAHRRRAHGRRVLRRPAEADEAEIRALARMLYERVDWAWMLARRHDDLPRLAARARLPAVPLGGLRRGARPLPAGARLADPSDRPRVSTTRGAAPTNGRRSTASSYLYAGPLFIHQMSHIWCDFRGIRDALHARARLRLLREQPARDARPAAVRDPQPARLQRTSASCCWGITASDGPGPAGQAGRRRRARLLRLRRARRAVRSRRRHAGAVGGRRLAAVRARDRRADHRAPERAARRTCANPYGFKASFNPAFHDDVDDGVGWVSPYHFGINEGPTVLMIENHRSGLVWSLMRRCAPLRRRACARRLRGRLARRAPAERSADLGQADAGGDVAVADRLERRHDLGAARRRRAGSGCERRSPTAARAATAARPRARSVRPAPAPPRRARASTRGVLASSARVYGWRGAAKSAAFGARSMTRPRYITITSSAISSTTARLCEMKT